MSRDCRYLLEYEVYSYSQPTPMSLDKQRIAQAFKSMWPTDPPQPEFVELHYGYLIYFEMPKYGLSFECIDDLKADQVFEAADDGSMMRLIKHLGKHVG